MFMATQLLDECTHMHPLCKAPQTTALPIRVLDVGSIANDRICLLVSKDRKTRYAALSYCWGGKQEVVANEGSWEAMTRGIATSMLPKTIQDAVTVTRKLGLQYLWVDSLCIKQDSIEDWASESSKMGDVYGKATVTIAAAGASTCSAGCFIQDSSNPARFIEEIRLRLPDLSIGAIALRVQNSYSYDTLEDPLNQRAWALQERLLSPRLLIYGLENLSWQCQTIASSQGIGTARLPDVFFKLNPVDSHEAKQWDTTYQKNSPQILEYAWARVSLD